MKMNAKVRKVHILEAAGVVAVAVLVAATLLFRTETAAATAVTPPPGSTVIGVTDSELNHVGLTLSPGSATSPVVAQASAERAALDDAPPGTTVRSSVLKHVTFEAMSPPVERDLWVVSLTPWGHSDGPPGSHLRQWTYQLVFVDPSTGAIVFGLNGG
jgi:hypothetical protein